MEPRRHEELYFADGNVALCSAGTGPERVIFRVHQSVLACNSNVFKDMFSLPTVAGVNETFDGVPLILTTDVAKALEGLRHARIPSWEDIDVRTCHQTRVRLPCCRAESRSRERWLEHDNFHVRTYSPVPECTCALSPFPGS